LALGLDLSGRVGLELVTRSNRAESAERVGKTLDAILTLGQNSATKLLGLVRAEAAEAPGLSEMLDVGEQTLKSARVERDGKFVRLKTSAKSEGLAGLVRLMIKEGL